MEMVTRISQNIEVSVLTKYSEKYSKADEFHYLFLYKISIKNHGFDTVQLKSRHWFIFDSNGQHREVVGPGVVGEEPILLPGQIFTYESACNLNTEIGSMRGFYTFENTFNRRQFFVEIPEFKMIAPYKLN
jgi:ApaG protein